MPSWTGGLYLSVSTLLLTGLSGCGSSAAAFNSVLRLPLYGASTHDAGIFDPARATPSTPLAYVSLTQVGLVKLSPDLHVLPELAVSLPTISPSGRTYTFTIRQDARFSDGKHCTASDVAYSLERALRYGSPLARQYLGGIVGAGPVESRRTWRLTGVGTPGRLTVRIRLRQPDVTFLTKLAFPVAAIVEPERSPSIPAGLGPFALAGRDEGGMVALRPRAHYYGATPAVHEVQLIPVLNEARGLTLYHSGGLDVARVPFESFAGVQQNPELYQSPSLDAYYAFPAHPAPLLNATVNRQALAAAMGPATQPLDTLVPPAVPDYQGSAASTMPPFTRLPPRVNLVFDPPHDATARALRSALLRRWQQSRTGMRVIVKHVWFLLPDPGRWLALSPDATRSQWYGAVLRQGRRLTFDLVGRMGLYENAENWSLGRGSAIPLVSGQIGYLEKASVDGLNVTPEGLMPANDDWSQVGLSSSR